LPGIGTAPPKRYGYEISRPTLHLAAIQKFFAAFFQKRSAFAAEA
jgi:hypothetical protein